MTKLNLRAAIMMLHTLLWTAAGIFIMLINPTAKLYLWLAHHVWSKQSLKIAGAPLTVKGLDNLDPKQSYIVCVNHQSLLDIPVLFRALPIPIRFVAKKSLFHIPIFGWSMYIAGFVPVDRRGGKKARESLKIAARRIKNGRSVTVFPEGTRSPDGKIHKFKAGAFIMAIESGAPILPVVINGTFELGPKSAIKVYPHPVEVVVGEPIPTDGLTPNDRMALSNRTRETMMEMRTA
jgi:1-acyl-sn-glycerol-3-phosphate acyltransferase